MSESNYWNSVWARRLTRRTALRGAAVSGLSLAALSVIACGEGDETGTAAPTSTPPPSTGTSTPAGTATPAQPTTGPGTAKQGGKVSVAQFTSEAPGYDPHQQINSGSLTAASFVYSRLARLQTNPQDDEYQHQLLTEGDVAESFESPDQQNWTVKLRQNVTWHNRAPANGRPFTSQDVVWNLQRFMAEGLGKDAFVNQIESYEAPDDHTVTFRLKQPYVPFVSLLANPIGMWLVNREVVEADGDANKNMLGTGPFMTQVWQTGSGMLMERNPNFFETVMPYLQNLDALLIADTKTAIAQFRSGGVDILPRIDSPEDVDAVRSSNADTVVRTANNVNNEWFFFEPASYSADKAPFNDIRVRQAVSMAIDRDGMIEAYYGGQGAYCAGYMFSNFGEWYVDPRSPEFGDVAKVFQFNLEEAKALMSAAGYADGVPDEVPMHFTTGYGSAFQTRAEANAAFMQEIGITPKLVPEEYGQYISNTFLGNFDGMAFGLPPLYSEVDDLLTGGFHPSSSRNHSKINDPQLTEMIDRQRTLADRAERVALVHDIVRYQAEQCYYPSTVTGVRYRLVQPWVHDYALNYGYGVGVESFRGTWTDKA